MAFFHKENSTNTEMLNLEVNVTPDARSRRAKTSKSIARKLLAILLTLLALTLTVAAAFYLYEQNRPPPVDLSWNEEEELALRPIEIRPFEPLKRYSLDYDNVACWQDDGVWIKHLAAVELSFIDVDRFQDTDRAIEQADEDAFCTHLRMLGASFWKLPSYWPGDALDYCLEPTKKVSLEVAFPTSGGGVWVLDTSLGGDGLYPKSLGLQNALTMDERCEVIKDLGGHFCEDIQVCPEIAALL